MPSLKIVLINPLYFLLFFCFVHGSAVAQVTTVVYNENFNSGAGGWVIGGFHPSWNYGSPSLPNIVSNGTACFATGDGGAASSEPFASCLTVTTPTTTGNFYNCCERSFVESPVIDLTGVNSPLLSLDINVYCEQTFDGAKLQLSINGGQSWQDVGAYNSATYQFFPTSLNCREKNWYNKNNINYLASTAGGCGNVNFSFGGGNSGWSGGCALAASGACSTNDYHGTNGWITATHCIPQAANQSNVKLRIAFGSGSQVYADGIAFDNVKISDVYPVVNFTGTQIAACSSFYQFANNTDCAENYSWNFGHPGSPGNTSIEPVPLHEFPAAGTYQVTLTATDFCGGSAVISKPVTVNTGNAPVITTITPTETLLCDSSSGALTIVLSPPGNPPYNVNYTFNNATVSLTGFTGSPIVLAGLFPGAYNSFSISDSNGCEAEQLTAVVIPYNDDDLEITISDDTLMLPGDNAFLEVAASIPASFTWAPPGTLDDPFSSTPTASPLITTTYSVVAIDTNGCSVTETVTVFINDTQLCNRYFIPNSFTPNGDGKNDLFQCIIDPALNLVKYNLIIFDRWGEPVFQSEVPGEGWNGKNRPAGIYIVAADFECRNKKTSRYNGILNVIR